MDYDKLKAQLDAAPFVGTPINEILIAAAAAVDEDNDDFVFARPHLFEAMPASARTLIPYVSRGATVARATRQALLDRLTGQYLVVTTGADASLPNAVAMVQRDAACREDAVRAAILHEGDVYAHSASTLVYRNLAARQHAQHDWLDTARNQDGDVAPVVPHQPRVPRGIIRADLPNMGPVNDVPPGNQAADEVPGATHASNQAAAIEAAPGNAAAPFEPAVKADSQTRASSSELPSELPSVPRSASSSPPDMPPQQRVVHKAVTVFVKETLNPLYKAGVIDRDVFKEVAAKSVAKIEEGARIQQLVKNYVMHVRAKQDAAAA